MLVYHEVFGVFRIDIYIVILIIFGRAAVHLVQKYMVILILTAILIYEYIIIILFYFSAAIRIKLFGFFVWLYVSFYFSEQFSSYWLSTAPFP